MISPFEKYMRRRTRSVLIGVVVLFGFLIFWTNAYVGFVSADSFNPYGYALEHLARAETAQTPDEVIEHVMAAKTELSRVGHVPWWSTDKESFDSIQIQLDGIIARAQNISSLELGDEVFNSEMSDIHSKLRAIQESLLAF
jgi:hypothetical protein